MEENIKEQKESEKKLGIKDVVIIVLILLLLLIAMFVIRTSMVKKTLQGDSDIPSNIKVSTEAVEKSTVKNEQPMTYFVGYDDQYVTKDEAIELGNDSSNTADAIYIEFTIIDENGKEIYKSDLVEPGKVITWTPGDYLDVGAHDLVFHEQPYKIIDATKEINSDNLQALYYLDQNVSVTITD